MSKHGWRRAMLTLVGVLVLFFTVPVEADQPVAQLVLGVVGALAGACLVAALVFHDLRRMLSGQGRKLTLERLVLVVELAVVSFALAYYLLSVHGDGEFVGLTTRLDALYFSVTTLTTTGFGDVHAEGQVARGVVTGQLLFDVLFLAALARLANDAFGRRN